MMEVRVMGYVGDEAKIVRYAKEFGKMTLAELDQLFVNAGMASVLNVSRENKIAFLTREKIQSELSDGDLWRRVSGSVSPIYVAVNV